MPTCAGDYSNMQTLANRMAQIDTWPRTIQANMARFYLRVIGPVVTRMPLHEEIVTGVAPDMDTFLDRCRAQVDNYTANEANKVYALVLIALFERYLRLWAAAKFSQSDFDFKRKPLLDLLEFVGIDLPVDLKETGLLAVFQEAQLVGNIVRHGEGRSMQELYDLNPSLVDRSKRQYVDLVDLGTPDSEWLKITPADLERYFNAMIKFWGVADTLPLAVTSITAGTE